MASTAESIRRSLSSSQKAELLKLAETVKRRRRWREGGPLLYAIEKLGVRKETLDWSCLPRYADHRWDGDPNPLVKIMDAIARGAWCGVESANAVGKTYLGAIIVLWFLECFDRAIVVTSAPKEKQLELHIWKEIGVLHPRFALGELSHLSLKMRPPGEDWAATGFVAGASKTEADSSATRAQGFHAKHMLIILEETPGIRQSVITAFENTSTSPHNVLLAFGNPDSQFDTLHTFCSLQRVVNVRISALDHPNVVLKDPDFVPGAVSVESIEEKLDRYRSADSPMYLSRVKGISPAQSVDSLINIQWCYAARDRELTVSASAREAYGVDVANSPAGDKASVAKGKGPILRSVESFPCPNANQLGHRVGQEIKDRKAESVKARLPVTIDVAVDGVGVGSGTVNTMRDDYKVELDPLTGGVVDDDQDENDYNSLRSQMWWWMREDLRMNVVQFPDDPELFQDLCAPRWQVRSGKICVESKEEFKARLGRSPDKGDSCVYWNWARRTQPGAKLKKFKDSNFVPSVASGITGF